MKLILTRKALPHFQSIRVDWQPETRGVLWSSVFYVPTAEELELGWSVDPKIQQALFAEFSSLLLPSEGKIYAILYSAYPFEDEFRMFSNELRSTGYRVVMWPAGWRSRLLSWFGLRASAAILEMKKEHVVRWFRELVVWQENRNIFVSSKDSLPNWISELEDINLHRRIRKRILERVELIMLNHYDQGLEVMSLSISETQIENIARKLSEKFEIPLEVRDTMQSSAQP